MNAIKKWIKAHPDLWEFILFNILSNCATVTNFVVMWLCTGFIFKSLKEIPFHFFIFDYTSEGSLMLCGFLSFLIATAAAQTVNFFVQKNWVFKSNAAFASAVPKYILLAVVLVIVSAALPAYSQQLFIQMGIPTGLAPTLANVLNIFVQVVLSYPTMKFWIMPKQK
ncbi:GtrA domain-containing protein [Konateibacter massiliensis]|uniref:GtrA family protein n=1 Tax=Konateibacter massiliensis TaxID=2002841 RepID=UPI000C14E252|nr:GtrA family protein [Konateibacter massiliensis]